MTSRDHLSTRTGDFEILTEGPSDGPLALCLHGFPDFPPSFEPLLRELAAAGYRAVAPWMRGYRPSIGEGPFHLDCLAEDALALADALSPGRRVFLIGHDWGAVTTHIAIAKWPDRFAAAVTMAVPHMRAFLEDAWQHPGQLRRSWYMGLFQLPTVVAERAVRHDDFALIDRLWRAWSPGFVAPPEHMRALKDCLARSMPAPIRYYVEAFRPVGELARRLREAGLPERRIRVPTLSLAGEQDGCIGLSVGDSEGRFFAGPFRREIVADVGHFMQLERPSEIARRVLAWLEPSTCGA